MNKEKMRGLIRTQIEDLCDSHAMKLGEQIALTDTDIEYKYGVLDHFLVRDIKRYHELGHNNRTIASLVKRPTKMVTRVIYKLKKAKMKKEGLA